MFKEIVEESFPKREEDVLSYWEERGTFLKSVEQRQGGPLFSFYDGPPFATGLPHYGHLLVGTIKDVVHRYKTMKGYYLPRRFGWDCHGLPVENEIEKVHNLTGASAIEEYGIARFNEECRKIVLRYTKEWEGTVKRMGRWVDFGHTYRTMDISFMESVWWVFKQLYEKGLVYEGYKVMPFSAKLGTPLSNFEATQNYKEVDDPALTVAFQVEGEEHTYLLAWTTTPWTLISNLAITAHPDITYVKVEDKAARKKFILSKDRLSTYYKSHDEYIVLEEMSGKALAGTRYMPLFPHFADQKAKGAFRVLNGDFVTTEDGTGLVHTAPAFGEDDFYVCLRAGIEPVCPVDRNGKFTEQVPEYVGQFVRDCDKDIIRHLKKEGKLVHQGTIRHRYPFCWRSDTPLIYRAMSSWFVSVEKIKDRLLAANEKIHWVPEHVKEGRFGKWLEGARDWAISRNRYWGTPIPLWRAPDGELIAIGSIKELEELTGAKITDLHRHHIDDLVIRKNGKEYTRVPEVFDCWFESGSMPYAQDHYPFEHKVEFGERFPADFIAEALDQTRGWFYTLTVLSVALFDKPAFKNCVVNGIVLAEDGQKMSKRLRNYPDPLEVAHKYGADAIRLYMLHSPVVRADNLCFSEKGVEHILRQILIPLWNSYSFLVTYARIYDWHPDEKPVKPSAEIDRWLLSVLNKLIEGVEKGMDGYDLSLSVEPFVGFVEEITNWYIRRSRRRFWDDKDTADRREAFWTLYTVLFELTKVCAPYVPFMSEVIYQNLRRESDPESVHLCDYPKHRPEWRDKGLEEAMSAVQMAVSLGHGLRKENKLKVRQPLARAHVAAANKETLSFLQSQEHLIKEELNVKEVVFSGDETRFVKLKAKPNFRVLGKKVGKLMPLAHKAIEGFGLHELHQLLNGREVSITLDGENVVITSEDVAVERQIHEGMVAGNEGDITVALDTALTDALVMEGLAREVVNKINTMRRDAGFAVSDRIVVKLDTTPKVEEAFKHFEDYICGEVLAVKVSFAPCEGTEWDLNGERAVIAIEKR